MELTVIDLVNELLKMPPKARVIISVDESTPKKTVEDRVFSQPMEVQKNGENSVSILCYE